MKKKLIDFGISKELATKSTNICQENGIEDMDSLLKFDVDELKKMDFTSDFIQKLEPHLKKGTIATKKLTNLEMREHYLAYLFWMENKTEIIKAISLGSFWLEEYTAALFSPLVYEYARPCAIPFSVAFYGEDCLHGGLKDERFDIQFSLGCWKGQDFNQNIKEYLCRNIIVMGGDDSYSRQMGPQIEKAVKDHGAILLTNFWSYRSLPSTMLPSNESRGANYGTGLTSTDHLKEVIPEVKEIYPHKGNQLNRGYGTAKKEATTWLAYDDGSPAVISWNYGKGMVLLRSYECNKFGIPKDLMLSIFDAMLKQSKVK